MLYSEDIEIAIREKDKVRFRNHLLSITWKRGAAHLTGYPDKLWLDRCIDAQILDEVFQAQPRSTILHLQRFRT
jgi:hypothetical protein